jgi:hypothetical protein
MVEGDHKIVNPCLRQGFGRQANAKAQMSEKRKMSEFKFDI